MLGTQMVREGFGVAGDDIDIGAANRLRAAGQEKFAAAFGLYFDNDTVRFSSPHPAARDLQKPRKIVRVIEATLAA
ncbi:hypothetical protein RCH14_002775 [Massilia sp. MP_M2]|uniref:hypothetical protein n=1 Tax=Massilia sp. MP_M2 TaxID=3071713 RepID=UPI00319D8D33